MELKGRVALVTGASSGIGRGAAERLALEGATVGLLGRTPDELDAVRDAIQGHGGTATILVADVSDADAMKKAVDQLVGEHGRLDIVVANAGVNGVWAPVDELTPEEWDKTFAINLRGTYLTLHYAVPAMKANGGSIVIVSSINGTRTFSNPGTSAYASTKAGQLALGQVTALELAKHRIRVNVVCPGAIATSIDENTEKRNTEEAAVPVEYPQGQVPLTGGEPGTIREVAELILFLASDRSRHISGTPIWIDGAQSLLV